jgi:hypothetical protein
MAFLGTNVRRRHCRCTVGRWVVSFSVQLEIWLDDQWHPIVRYDTSHGYVDRDLLHADGTVEKTAIDIASLNEALTFCENDLKANWRPYVDHFLAGRGEPCHD